MIRLRQRSEPPLRADAVEKVSEKALWNWNLKQTNRSGRILESRLRVSHDR
jgi:hypothetical protein